MGAPRAGGRRTPLPTLELSKSVSRDAALALFWSSQSPEAEFRV